MTPVLLDQRVKRDLAIALTTTFCFFLICFHFDANEAWVRWAEAYEDFELDELPLAMCFAGLSFCWFAYRRWQDNSALRLQTDRLNQELAEEVKRRTKSEDALRRSEQRSMDFAIASADRFWETGPDFRVAWAHESEPSENQLPISSILGKTLWEIVGADPETDPKWQAHLEDHREHKPIRDFEYYVPGVEDEQVWWRISAVPVFDDQGKYTGHRGIAQDITENRRFAEQLQAAQRLNAIGQLTGGVAHDFNNLLANIVLSTDLLRDRLREEDDRGDKIADQIIRAVQRGRSLTDRLLSYARQQSLSAQSWDVAEHMAGLDELLRRTLGETINLEIHQDRDVWPALVDSHQLDGSLLNLAINARDAMPEGGTLKITYSNATLGKDFTRSAPDLAVGDYVKISIRDDGAGMAREVLEKAFEPFFTTKEFGEGSGLGLSMVYGFAMQSKGHVTIDSQLGQGTEVNLYLPRAKTDPPKRAEGPKRTQPASGSELILLVEDDADLRDIFATMLDSHGYKVVSARTGKEAITHLNGDDDFDLLLTDMVLPGGVNGAQVAELAKKLQPGLKTLYMTGYSDTVLGSVEGNLIRKPCRQYELLETVRAILD